MKKILIFSLSYYPNISGAEAAVKEITDRISDVEFHMVTLRYSPELPKEERIGNVLVHRIGFTKRDTDFKDYSKFPLKLNKRLFQFSAAFKGYSLHKKYNYDGAWAMMAHSSGVPVAIFNMLTKKSFVLTLQEGDPIEYIEKTMKPLWYFFTKAFTKASVVQVISRYLADWAKNRGVKEENIELIHNGANPRDLNPSNSQGKLEHLEQKLGKQSDDIFLVNTARLVHQKGNNNTIEALVDLPKNIKLVLVGSGPEEKMLKDLAKKLKLEDRVIFVGQVDRSEVSQYRQISDIFVCPSRSEGLGNAFLSAMASRLPVVATREGGLKEFISDETAWVVEKDDPKQIAQAIKDILGNPDKTKNITDNAHDMVSSKYNWDNIADKMQTKVFAKIL